MISFLLWVLLLVICWPLAILALMLWPLVWLLSLPFRLLGIAVEGVFELLRGHHHVAGARARRRSVAVNRERKGRRDGSALRSRHFMSQHL